MPDDPHRRLLDLLGGWAHFVGQDIEAGKEDNGECDAINALYQEVGSYEDMSEGHVIQFVNTRIIPLLARGIKKP